MGLEYSEGFTAALSVMSDDDLAMADSSAEGGVYNGVKYDKKFQEIYQKSIDLFQGGSIKDGQGNKTKIGMDKKMNAFTFSRKLDEDGNKEVRKEPSDDMYKDFAAGVSAIRGIRTKYPGPAGAAYLTGNKWNSAVAGFRIEFQLMKDYNSSDVIIESGGEFVGISLKKKATVNAASPPLINNAFSNFIKGDSLKDAADAISDAKMKFFANIIWEACQEGGPLNPSKELEHVHCKEIAKLNLNPNVIADAKKIWEMKVTRFKYDKKGGKLVLRRKKPTKQFPEGEPETEKIKLINLKGLDNLVNSTSYNILNNNFPAEVKTNFRSFINSKLTSKDGLSLLYDEMLKIMDRPDVKDKMANTLLDRSLKLSLLDNLDMNQYGKFDFYLVTGVGNVGKASGKVDTIKANQASVIPLTSIITANSMLRSQGTWIKVEPSTFKNNAASVDFTLYKGPKDNKTSSTAMLHLTLRYGGDFSASPRFHATMHDDFKKVIIGGEKHLKGTAGY